MNEVETQKSDLATKLKEEIFLAIESTMKKESVSQGEVARRIGANRSNINKVFRRKLVVSIDFLLKIAETLGLDAEIRLKKSRD